MNVAQGTNVETYVNRYGDQFKFYPLEDGNIQWEGKFEHVRIGWPIEDDMSEQDAIEYFEYNVQNAYVGPKTPIWCDDQLVFFNTNDI